MRTVYYYIGNDPRDPLPPLPPIPRGALVVIEGPASAWGYAIAVERVQATPAGAAAIYAPELKGAVVAFSRRADLQTSEILPITPADRFEVSWQKL